MIEFNVKLKAWQFALAIIIFCSVVYAFIYWNSLRNWQDNLKQAEFKAKLSEAKKQTDTAVKQYTERIEQTNNIVERYNTIHDTILKRDTILAQAKRDINYMDTTIKKCDTALKKCLFQSHEQDSYIAWLEKKRKNKIGFGATVGPGMQLNNNGVSFGAQLTWGLTFK